PSSARISAPMALPSINLAGNADRPCLADHHDLDLSGILQLALDLARDLVGQTRRPTVIHRLRRDDYADFAARLDGEDLVHALELGRQLLEVGQPLHVRLEGLAPRAGARAGDRVGSLHDHADRRFVRHVVVVRRDAVDHDRLLAVLGRHLDAELHVRAVVLVGEDFADVVQERAALGETDVELQLGGHHAGEVGDFLGVLEDVLPVRRAVLHASDQLHQLGMHATDSDVIDRLLAGFDDALIHVGLGLFHDLFDAPGMDAAVGDQAFERQAADFAAHRLEVGRLALERLIADGRIHPGRIEEIVKKAQADVDQSIVEAGEQAVYDIGIRGMHAELVKLVGRMKYRTSYGQNILEHSKEVAHLAGMMAAELKLDVSI